MVTKALTICQPYASLIVGWPGMDERWRKPVENRRWPALGRRCGRHASFTMPPPTDLLIHAGKSRQWLSTWSGPTPPDMPFGAILGRVQLVAFTTPEEIASDPRWRHLRGNIHVEGPYCLVLEQPERLELPIPYRGQQGFFAVPDAVLADARWSAVEPVRCRN